MMRRHLIGMDVRRVDAGAGGPRAIQFHTSGGGGGTDKREKKKTSMELRPRHSLGPFLGGYLITFRIVPCPNSTGSARGKWGCGKP